MAWRFIQKTWTTRMTTNLTAKGCLWPAGLLLYNPGLDLQPVNRRSIPTGSRQLAESLVMFWGASCQNWSHTSVKSRYAYGLVQSYYNEKKCWERCKHCTLAVVRRSQKFLPRRRPPQEGVGRPKFNQLEMVTTITYKPSLVRIDAHNFELSW